MTAVIPLIPRSTIHVSPAPPVDSADRALQLVLLLQSRESVRVADAAVALGVARSTAHRLLTTLRYRDFAVQTADHRYLAGPALRGSRHTRTAEALVELVAPRLDRLRDDVGETVHLIGLDGQEAVFWYSAVGRRPLHISSRTGTRLPAHLTSGGKVLLAGLPKEEIRALYGSTLSDTQMAGLHRSLAAVRATGRGLNESRTEAGISAVSVGVQDNAGRLAMAVSASVPAVRLTPAVVERLEAALHGCAVDLRALLG